MDNLQKHYLTMLAGAQQMLLSDDGDISKVLDVCFELRLKPDLALYTRAMVNLTICDIVHFEMYAQKLDLAVEALRIANRLQAKENPAKDAFWIAKYDKLKANAESSVTNSRREQEDYLRAMEAENNRSARMIATTEMTEPMIEDEEAVDNGEDDEVEGEDNKVFDEGGMYDPAGIFRTNVQAYKMEDDSS